MGRVLVIALDGYEISLAEKLMSSGHLPALAALREESARFSLDHGLAKLTGLAAEHVSSGLSPEQSGRSSAVYFDRHTYQVWQEGTLLPPFPSKLKAKTIVFDLSYFDLKKAPNVRGICAWGAHDAGIDFMCSPESLSRELLEKFGPYPGTEWIYGFAWPAAERCQAMGDALTAGADLRSKVAHWLLKDRFSDWELGMIGVSEAHSVLEGLWHGTDEQHPLHRHPSSSAAGNGIRNVYAAIDRLIGDLATAFADATMVVFSMHGMGANQSDVASMVLLPELLCRHVLGQSVLLQQESWDGAEDGIPMLGEHEGWEVETRELRSLARQISDYAAALIPAPLRNRFRWGSAGQIDGADRPRKKSLQWIPGARYQPLWHKMAAFALPSFYDGRIRINLQGRERHGIVPLEKYESVCQELETILAECRDPATGEQVFDRIKYNGGDNPRRLSPWAADLEVIWKGASLAFEHPMLGRIGPIPYRRTGGHTGPRGMAYLKGKGITPGDFGTRSSFDVVPTLLDLLGERPALKVSGRSLLPTGSV
ncbi:MAG: alkaline phosphatase family protein [Gammaproteobacteria bacterium]